MTIHCWSLVFYFNSQPHKEADVEENKDYTGLHISTHSLTRRLTTEILLILCILRISTHSLTRRLTRFPLCVLVSPGYFNSQPHKEADEKLRILAHAHLYFNSQPHKEADRLERKEVFIRYISTHSLTRRLTDLRMSGQTISKNFNSQPHKEADLPERLRCSDSIHFNSQPHKEADR